jgi:acyl-CoA-binding protein
MKIIQMVILVLFALYVPATSLDEAIQNPGSVTDAQTYKYPTNRIFSPVSPQKDIYMKKLIAALEFFTSLRFKVLT